MTHLLFLPQNTRYFLSNYTRVNFLIATVVVFVFVFEVKEGQINPCSRAWIWSALRLQKRQGSLSPWFLDEVSVSCKKDCKWEEHSCSLPQSKVLLPALADVHCLRASSEGQYGGIAQKAIAWDTGIPYGCWLKTQLLHFWTGSCESTWEGKRSWSNQVLEPLDPVKF